jgi:hypothetical protein
MHLLVAVLFGLFLLQTEAESTMLDLSVVKPWTQRNATETMSLMLAKMRQTCAPFSSAWKSKDKVNLTIMGLPRSGTTYLMHLMAGLHHDAFVLPEPYTYWEETNSFRTLDDISDLPRPEALFDCSEFRTGFHLHWLLTPFACDNMPQIRREPELYKQCQTLTIHVNTLAAMCKNSPLKIVKFLRLHYLSNLIGPQKVFPDSIANSKVIHIVRNPVEVLRSVSELGWLDESIGLVPQLNLYCAQIKTHLNILKALPARNVLTIRYEDLRDRFPDTMARILCKFKLPLDDDAIEAMKVRITTEAADFQKLSYGSRAHVTRQIYRTWRQAKQGWKNRSFVGPERTMRRRERTSERNESLP